MSSAKVGESVKKAAGHPMLNMIILGTSSGLMTISAISGLISYGKLGSELSGTRNLLLGASLLSMLSAALLGISIFLVHRHAKKMESAFQGMISLILLATAGLFMFISAIMYAVAAVKMNAQDPNNSGKTYKDTYGTSHTTAVLSAVMTFGALGATGVSLLFAILGGRGKKPAPVAMAPIGPPPVTTQVDLEPSYTDEDGAEKQLSELQIGSGALGGQNTNPEGTGTV